MAKFKAFVVSRKVLFNRYGGKCAYCGKALQRSGWHRDHVEPIIRHRGKRYTFSGRNGCKHPENHRADNIVAACSSCNIDKGNMDLETWRASLDWTFHVTPIVFWFERYSAGAGKDGLCQL